MLLRLRIPNKLTIDFEINNFAQHFAYGVLSIARIQALMQRIGRADDNGSIGGNDETGVRI